MKMFVIMSVNEKGSLLLLLLLLFLLVCFFLVPFLCMNQGWQNALWVKSGCGEGFWEINKAEFSSH